MSSPEHLPLSRSTVDRGGYLREDPEALDEVWREPDTQVVLVDEGKTLVDSSGEQLVCVPADEAPEGERYYLGRAENGAYFAVRAPLPEPSDSTRAAGLREVGVTLGDRDAGLATHAVALERWHAKHQHCPQCGAATVAVRGGSQRDCPVDGSSHFPRVDPAVIMLVHDGGDHCVLARQAAWPAGRFSVLAGFVEPGESLERAVAREVGEEVALDVDEVRYVASQPWPFPSSLMLGFTARVSGGSLAADGKEIADAAWFARHELATAVEKGSVLLPSAVSIAHRLIEQWYGGRLRGPR